MPNDPLDVLQGPRPAAGPRPAKKTAAGPATAKASHSHLLSAEESTAWVQLTVTGPPLPGGSARPPADVAIVIDGSGSMGFGPGSPFSQAQKAARYVIENLSAEDRCALVLFGQEARILAPLSSDHQKTLTILDSARDGGMTAFAAGLYQGIEQLNAGDGARSRQVFVLSDGHANVGDTDPALITSKVQAATASGVRIATFGLGASYDEVLLEALALGGGGYHFLESPDDVPAAFSQELDGLLQTTLADTTITLTSAKGVSIGRVLGFERTNGTISIGGVPAGVERHVLVEVTTTPGTGRANWPLLEAHVSWSEPGASTSHSQTLKVAAKVSADADVVAAGVDDEVISRVLELEAAESQRVAADFAIAGNFAGAQAALRSSAGAMSAYMASSPLAAQALASKLEEVEGQADALADSGSFNQLSVKGLRSSSYLTRTSRS